MKIAIAGYGIEGKSSYAYFSSRGHDVTIVDERDSLDTIPEGARTLLGTGVFSKLNGFDMVIRTPSLSPRSVTTDGKIWSATNEFFAKCTTPIIGVTGTKGKGTVSSMVVSILRASNHKVVLVGNIGQPALELLDEANEADVVVYEMSSFQLWDLEKSPQVAVVLMIEPDHLDVHANFDEYIAAKANIRKYQTESDICFYHPTNVYSRQIAGSNIFPNAHRYNDRTEKDSIYVENGWFVENGSQRLSVDAVQIPGAHNLENACAAISAALRFTSNWGEIEEGLRSFHGLDHRLKFVRTVEGVSYYDDSIATTPGSAIAAVKAFSEPKIIILGGSSKGANFEEMAAVFSQSAIKTAILIGDQADVIETVLSAQNVPIVNLGSAVTMTDIVQVAAKQATAGDVVILSPACASFGMFKSYSDRGDQFIAAVNNL
jgi:UDP-N-acetylmuramoylalanine--D-glutamate ligase